MTLIQYDGLNEGAAYDSFRFGVIKALWGAQKNPYLACDNEPFIGSFFKMTTSIDDLKMIAETILGITVDGRLLEDLWSTVCGTFSTKAELRNSLNAVLADNDINRTFAFAGDGQIKAVLNSFSTTAFAESMLSYNDQNLPLSEERAAVFSMAYEGADITSVLQAMLVDGDRFRAWFEIRYNSNNGTEQTAADKRDIAERRYIQSDVFELYNDPDSVDYDEAFDVARGYQSNRAAILAYEHSYNPNASGNSASGKAGNADHGINAALQPAIAAIAKEFGFAAGHLEEVLYVRRGSPDLSGDGTAFDSKRNDDDLLIGDARGNRIVGGVGNDLILGLGGIDRIIGGLGNDRLYGYSGDDVLTGAMGNDRMDGGAGKDTLDGSEGNDWLYGNAGNDRLIGGSGNDTLLGGNDDDVLIGGGGKDRLQAGYGDDKLDGGGGKDRLVGLDGKDNLSGGDGNDVLLGGNDNDVLKGGAGNDRLDGGGGTDMLIGGLGNDTYLLLSDKPDKTRADPDPGPDPDPDPNPDGSLTGGGNSDVIVELRNGGIDTVFIGEAGKFDIRNVEHLVLAGGVAGNVSVALNQFESFTLSDKADTLTLTINKLRKEPFQIITGDGADTVRINIAPGIDPSQVLDHKGLTARFEFSDLTASDTIDLTSLGIKKIVSGDLNITSDNGFYLMAPDSKIHLMNGGVETKTYNNDTDSWFVVKCGDDTPYGPEFLGHVSKDNFDI